MPVSLRADYPLGTARGCTCYLCGADRKGEPVVDCQLMIVDEGRLMICASCVVEAAGLLGMIHPETRDEAVAAMHEIQRIADEAVADRDEAYRLVDLIRGLDEKHPRMPGTIAGPLPEAPFVTIPERPARRPRAAKNV